MKKPASRTGARPASIPPEFIGRMERLLGAESLDFMEALQSPPQGLRVNTLKLTESRFETLAPFEIKRLPYPEEGFVVGDGARPGVHPYHAAGLYYLQDPGAMAVGALVDPQPGERVLDLAAAPGGKSTHLAARMSNQGVLVANDVHRDRAEELSRNLERCGVGNAIVTSETADRLAGHFGQYFDRVLLDAPCSGEAMFHKSAAARADWSLATVAGCARRQAVLLDAAAPLVRPGGWLVYSTCTFSLEENEQVVLGFLQSNSDFEPAALPAVPGESSAAIGLAEGDDPDGRLSQVKRLWPHRVPGAGHFVAAFRRTATDGFHEVGKATYKVGGDITRLAADFIENHFLGRRYAPERLVLRGTALHALPAGAPILDGLRVVRPGVPLGRVEGRRFEPAHALALMADSGPPAAMVDLEIEDDRVAAFLEGRPITAQGVAGWVVVAVEGFALGWGKRVGATVKNHYPKGLRRRG